MTETRTPYHAGQEPSVEWMQRDVLGWMGYHIREYPDRLIPSIVYYGLHDAKGNLCGSRPKQAPEFAWSECAPNLLTESGAAGLLTFLHTKADGVEYVKFVGCSTCWIGMVDGRVEYAAAVDWPLSLLRAAWAVCPVKGEATE